MPGRGKAYLRKNPIIYSLTFYFETLWIGFEQNIEDEISQMHHLHKGELVLKNIHSTYCIRFNLLLNRSIGSIYQDKQIQTLQMNSYLIKLNLRPMPNSQT